MPLLPTRRPQTPDVASRFPQNCRPEAINLVGRARYYAESGIVPSRGAKLGPQRTAGLRDPSACERSQPCPWLRVGGGVAGRSREKSLPSGDGIIRPIIKLSVAPRPSRYQPRNFYMEAAAVAMLCP